MAIIPPENIRYPLYERLGGPQNRSERSWRISSPPRYFPKGPTFTDSSNRLEIQAGGLEVACWLLVPKFAGSNPAEAVGFLRVNKNPQHVAGHGCLSVVIAVCCQVEVSATN